MFRNKQRPAVGWLEKLAQKDRRDPLVDLAAQLHSRKPLPPPLSASAKNRLWQQVIRQQQSQQQHRATAALSTLGVALVGLLLVVVFINQQVVGPPYGREVAPIGDPSDPVLTTKCAYPQGYWQQNQTQWPTTELQLGNQTYPQEDLVSLLETPARDNAIDVIMRELIVAKLNVAQGADGENIAQAITTLDAWLAAHPGGTLPEGDQAAEALNYGYLLEQYNTGQLDVRACPNDKPKGVPKVP